MSIQEGDRSNVTVEKKGDFRAGMVVEAIQDVSHVEQGDNNVHVICKVHDVHWSAGREIRKGDQVLIPYRTFLGGLGRG
jgi:hypothetical protein